MSNSLKTVVRAVARHVVLSGDQSMSDWASVRPGESMTNAVEQSAVVATIRSPLLPLDRSVHASLWRGILLVEPDITLLTAEVQLLARSNYSVTPAFSQNEIFALRQTKAIALAVLSAGLGSRPLAAVAHTVRKQWPRARILILGRAESILEDHLYDEQTEHSSDPMQLLQDIETLYKDSWNHRSNTLDWDVKRVATLPARCPIRESDPTKSARLKGFSSRSLPDASSDTKSAAVSVAPSSLPQRRNGAF
jgi:hypothetical protein